MPWLRVVHRPVVEHPLVDDEVVGLPPGDHPVDGQVSPGVGGVGGDGDEGEGPPGSGEEPVCRSLG